MGYKNIHNLINLNGKFRAFERTPRHKKEALNILDFWFR